MGVFSKMFGLQSGDNSNSNIELQKACDSDDFANILKAIDGDKEKLQFVVSYLEKQGNLSMSLRVLTLPIAEQGTLMVKLMSLEPKDAPNINKLCKDGFNPILHYSLNPGMEILIRLLAHAHANLDIVGFRGHTPLTMACEQGLTKTVQMLINNGAKAFDKADGSGWTPLHYACQLGNDDIVKMLIDAGANVNVLSSDNLMPIHVAISTVQAAQMSPTTPEGKPWSSRGALMCVQHLANAGANLNYRCQYGFSAMDFLRSIGVVK